MNLRVVEFENFPNFRVQSPSWYICRKLTVIFTSNDQSTKYMYMNIVNIRSP